MSTHTSGQFAGLRKATGAANMRGTIDFTQADSFNLYEKGHSILKVLSVPNFMTAWANFLGYGKDSYGNLKLIEYSNVEDKNNTETSGTETPTSVIQKRALCNNFYQILEQEFKGLDGLDDMTSDSMEITDGFSTLNVLGKVNYTTNKEITMRYTEKGGSTISRYAETYLRGIRDPRTGVKHYNGCLTTGTLKDVTSNGENKIANKYYSDAFKQSTTSIEPTLRYHGVINPSFENEVFTFLYIVLDNTWTQIERAYLLCNAQINKIPLGQVSNMEKGNIELAEIDLSFNCFVVTNETVNRYAAKYLPKILNKNGNYPGYNLISNEFVYKAQVNAVKSMGLTKEGTSPTGKQQQVKIMDGIVNSVDKVTTSLSK